MYVYFSMFCFSLVSNSFLTPKQLNPDAYVLNLSHSVILPQQPLGSLPRPGQMNTASLFPIASYQAAGPWG